jgi:hypothetical protein
MVLFSAAHTILAFLVWNHVGNVIAHVITTAILIVWGLPVRV